MHKDNVDINSNIENYVLIYNSVNYFIPHFKKKGIRIYKPYKEKGFLFNFFSKAIRKLGFYPFFLYDDWYIRIQKNNTIILFSTIPTEVIRFVQKKYPEHKIILWYWNPIKPDSQISDFISPNLEVWTFDKSDSEKYNLKPNTQFYFDTIRLAQKPELIYDVIFVGLDKGRREQIVQFQNDLLLLNLKPCFYIVTLHSKNEQKPVLYSDYLGLIASSRAILDLVQPGQHGLTLRPLEALFFKKKLITNNIAVRSEAFYHKDNIFILGVDDMNTLPVFLNSPLKSIDESILHSFDVKYWLQRFSEG